MVNKSLFVFENHEQNKRNVTNLLLAVWIWFHTNIWCSFAEYIRSPRNLSIFTTLENTSILYFSEFTKVKVLSVASNIAIKMCLVKMKSTF